MRGEKIVNLSIIKENLERIKGKTKTKIICVVKADAYGHGAYSVAKYLDSKDGYAVATTEEALEVKEAVMGGRSVLILSKVEESDYEKLIENGVSVTVDGEDELTSLSKVAGCMGKCASCHIAVNTGMNRIGLKYDKPLYKLINYANSLKNVKVEGVFSHLYSSDGTASETQRSRFVSCVSRVVERNGLLFHLGATSAVGKGGLYFDALRVGIGLYGYLTDGVNPAMTVKGKVVAINPLVEGETVGYGGRYISACNEYSATLSLGYADGVPRSFSGGEVLISGKRRKVIGSVCMDVCFALVDEKVKVGDEAVFIGGQGVDMLTAEDMAKTANTVPYEILTGFKRIKTIYE